MGWTVLYNVISLSLAAFGPLPLVLAGAQSLPDLGILAHPPGCFGSDATSDLVRRTRS